MQEIMECLRPYTTEPPVDEPPEILPWDTIAPGALTERRGARLRCSWQERSRAADSTRWPSIC